MGIAGTKLSSRGTPWKERAAARSMFSLSAGSVVGAEHLRLQRNNQDGVAIGRDGETIVAVITDGCSAGRYSEVGARAAARFIAARLLERPGEALHSAPLIDALLAFLLRLGQGLAPRPEQLRRVIADYLLFSFIAATIRPEQTVIFGLGDGLFSVNGQRHQLDAGPDNAPPYLAYRLLERPPLGQDALRATTYFRGRSAGISSLLIASDGLCDVGGGADHRAQASELIGELERDHRYLKNPSLTHKRLVALSARRPFFDDTSLALFRRVDQQARS